MTIRHWIILKMTNLSGKCCRENNKHFMSSYFFSENRAVYEIMSKNVAEPERPQMTVWRRVAFYISKATHPQAHDRAHAPTTTHTQIYVLLIAFPRQKWLCERSSVLRYTYIACLVIYKANAL